MIICPTPRASRAIPKIIPEDACDHRRDSLGPSASGRKQPVRRSESHLCERPLSVKADVRLSSGNTHRKPLRGGVFYQCGSNAESFIDRIGQAVERHFSDRRACAPLASFVDVSVPKRSFRHRSSTCVVAFFNANEIRRPSFLLCVTRVSAIEIIDGQKVNFGSFFGAHGRSPPIERDLLFHTLVCIKRL